jgi:hypothetical protein
MAKTFFEVEPDQINTTGNDHQRRYSFTYYEPDKKDQIGSYSVLVTSPPPFGGIWEATKFYRAGVAAYQVVSKRELTPREIKLFEQRIKAYEQSATE